MRRSTRRDHTIRGRVVRMLALPLAAMLTLLTVIYVNEISRYRDASAAERRITQILALQGLIQELQNERGLTVAVLGGNTAFRDRIAPARQRVDAQRAELAAALAGADDQLDGLARIRAAADTGDGERAETFDFYTGVIEHLADDTRHLEIVDDLELRRGAESLEMLTEVKEATAQEWVFLDGVITAGGFRSGEFSELLNIVAARDLSLGEFDEFADPAAAAAKTTLMSSDAATRAHAVERAALRAGDRQSLLADSAAWWTAVATMLDDMTGLAQQIGARTLARAEELRDRATLRLALLSAVVLLCLAGSAYLAIGATRSLAEPLAELAGEADRLAGDRLPEAVRRAAAGEDTGPPGEVPVAGGASAEVRRVADAFDRVQKTAYELATEQARLRRSTAESLADLGRRNQNLLRRQLGFITRLEREETSPGGLANLFELDHLATRMRRNAESLLVLVGAASPRQWPEPLPLADVIRAAVSEVEEYRRVVLRRLDDAMVQGAVASGLAHMLAELIENGLTFSPPDLEVEIHGRRVGDGYLIAVCDQGVGMSDADLDRANQRLRGEGDFMVGPAKFLGHYVVGRLAAEMRAEVRLTPSAVTGVTARISLPAELLAEPPEIGPAAPAPEPVRLEQPRTADPMRIRPRALEVDYVVVTERPAIAGLDSDRTANGLRKRIPRARRADRDPVPAPRGSHSSRGSHASHVSHGSHASHDEPTVAVSDAPGAVRDRLTALRAGLERGARPFAETATSFGDTATSLGGTATSFGDTATSFAEAATSEENR
ncbi:signal transduction histidine kinase/CHASE3 domain sensor protein [Actinoplanes octamycinicus]|uniref:histidine kinase n=1 Tax=Actinoplanes octamycinicus TaxID=135948 RepID=A0A7W7M804_9ACTN|nr:nitrate- and nitrite sensing domain-containing protein [Actinoplanes octamycinicus]MBB4740281.1 signal transduction histidine kinase/CHASE3 domain sensor protein [Actinoplanes octamycinicus]GIE62643.1 ATPase [Actinoplanes octamycinicus]